MTSFKNFLVFLTRSIEFKLFMLPKVPAVWWSQDVERILDNSTISNIDMNYVLKCRAYSHNSQIAPSRRRNVAKLGNQSAVIRFARGTRVTGIQFHYF